MNVNIVFAPEVVTVGNPVVVPEYLLVGILNITTPLPPNPTTAISAEAPPPPPVLTVPEVALVANVF